MEIIKVKEICGEYCIDENDVQVVSKKIIEKLNENIKVILDFSEVNLVLMAFFNGLFSGLFKKFDQTIIENLIGLTESTHDAVVKKYTRSLENAKMFYSYPCKVQNQICDMVDKIFSKEIALNNHLGTS